MEDIRSKILSEVRGMVPALSGKMSGEALVYLDNAATSQKPRQVLDFLGLS